MLVTAKKHNELKHKYKLLKGLFEAQQLSIKMMKIELDLRRNMANNSPQTQLFNDSELRQLLQLCHPDKHNNSATATQMTAKLLRMRKSR